MHALVGGVPQQADSRMIALIAGAAVGDVCVHVLAVCSAITPIRARYTFDSAHHQAAAPMRLAGKFFAAASRRVSVSKT